MAADGFTSNDRCRQSKASPNGVVTENHVTPSRSLSATVTAAIESPDAVVPQAGDDVAAAGDVDVVTWAPSVPYGYHPGFRSRRHHMVFLPPPPEVVGLAVGLDHRLHHDLHRAMARGAVHAAHALRGLFRALH